MVIVLWPLAGRFLRPTPHALGLAPDGIAVFSAEAGGQDRAPRPFRVLILNLRFITLSAGFALGLFAQVGLVTHLITRLVPELGEGLAASAVSFATVCAIAGRLVLAAFIGSANRRAAAAANFAMQACGAALLAFGSTVVVLMIGCALLGIGIGNIVSLPPLIAQVEFDRADVPRIMSVATGVNQAVFSFAPAVIGALHDASGTYAVPFAAAATILLMAGGVVLLGRMPNNSPGRKSEPC
jgi:hypothetical protein